MQEWTNWENNTKTVKFKDFHMKTTVKLQGRKNTCHQEQYKY